MKISSIILAAAATLAMGSVQAQGEDVLKTKGCLGCHDMDKKKVGPAFKDAAAKNKGNKDAAGAMLAKMKDGKGHPKVAASDAELNAAVKEILSTK